MYLVSSIHIVCIDLGPPPAAQAATIAPATLRLSAAAAAAAAVTPGPGTPACGPESDSKSHLPLTQALARAVSGPVPARAPWHWARGVPDHRQ